MEKPVNSNPLSRPRKRTRLEIVITLALSIVMACAALAFASPQADAKDQTIVGNGVEIIGYDDLLGHTDSGPDAASNFSKKSDICFGSSASMSCESDLPDQLPELPDLNDDDGGKGFSHFR